MQKNVFSFFLVLLSVAALLDAECNEGGCCYCDANGAVILNGFQANRCRSNYMCKCGFQRDQGWGGVCSDGDLEVEAFAHHIGRAVYKAEMEKVLHARHEALKTTWKQSIKKTGEAIQESSSLPISSLSPTSKESSSVPVKSTVTQQNYGQSADLSLPLRSSFIHQNNGKMETDQSTNISPLTPEARGSSSHSLQSIAIQQNPVKIENDQKANIPLSSFSKGSSSLPLMSTVTLHPGKIEISSVSPPKRSSSLPLMSTVTLHPGKIEISSVSPPKGSSSLPLETTRTQQNPGKMESADISSLSPKESSSLPLMSIVTQQNHDSDISSMSSPSNMESSSLPFKSTFMRQNHGKIETDHSADVSSKSPPSRESSLPVKSTTTLQNRGKMEEKVLRTHLPMVLPPSLRSSSVPQKSTITQQNHSKMEKDPSADIPSLSPPSRGILLHLFPPPVDSAEKRKNPPPVDSTETRKNPGKVEKNGSADIFSQYSPLNEKARRPSVTSNFRLKNMDQDQGSKEEAVERVPMLSTAKESGCRTCSMVQNSRIKNEDEDQRSKEEAEERLPMQSSTKESGCKSCSKVVSSTQTSQNFRFSEFSPVFDGFVQNPPITLQNSGDSTKSGKSTEKKGGCKSCLVVRNSDKKNKLENDLFDTFQKARRNCAYLPKQLCCRANENCGNNYDCYWYCCNGDCGSSYLIL